MSKVATLTLLPEGWAVAIEEELTEDELGTLNKSLYTQGEYTVDLVINERTGCIYLCVPHIRFARTAQTTLEAALELLQQ